MSEDFSSLQDLLGERLDLSNQGLNGLKDLNIRKRKKLQRLNLSGNRLTEVDLKEIASNKELTWLNVSSNELEDFPVLQNLKKLSVINASHNKIKSTKAFGSFNGLKALILNGNELQDSEGLESLKDLNSLVLSNNYLRAIDVSHFHAITKLSLSHNAIKEFPNLRTNPKLKEIRLNGNKIKQVSVTISHCRYLQLIDLGNNCIDSLSSIDTFKDLSFLVNLNLKGNPVAKEGDYAARIDKCCRHLRILDGQRRERFSTGTAASPCPNNDTIKSSQDDIGSEYQLSEATVSGKSSKRKDGRSKRWKETRASKNGGKKESKLKVETATVKSRRENQIGTKTNLEPCGSLPDRKNESSSSVITSVLKPNKTCERIQTCLPCDTLDSPILDENEKHLDVSGGCSSPSCPDQIAKKKRKKKKHSNVQKEQTGSCKSESNEKRDKRSRKHKAERIDARAAVVALKDTKAFKKQRPFDPINQFFNANDFGFGDGKSQGWE